MVRKRAAPKLNSILEDIRERIVRGLYLPGAKLPVRSDLEGVYGVSWATLQKAFDILREDGFVETRGRHGTFVAGHPPHLCEYALVFPYRPSEAPEWSRFYATLQQQAMEAPRLEGRRISIYYASHGDTSSRDFRQLMRDANRHRLAGTILSGMVGEMPLEGLLPKWLPKVVIAPTRVDNVPSVQPYHPAFWEKALEFVRSRGLRRVACFNMAMGSGSANHVRQIIEKSKVETRPYWNLIFEGSQSPAAAAHLLTRLPKEDRPQVLIVSDDNLVEATMAGLIAGGIRVPEELELVTHCNFPNPPPSILPSTRIGFDIRQLLHVCCDIIEMQAKGKAVPSQTVLPAVMESELSSRSLDLDSALRRHASMTVSR